MIGRMIDNNMFTRTFVRHKQLIERFRTTGLKDCSKGNRLTERPKGFEAHNPDQLTDYVYALKGRSGVLSCRLLRSGLTENATSLNVFSKLFETTSLE